MPTFGVLPEGFSIKPLETIKEELEDSFIANIDANLNVTSTSISGQIIGITSEGFSDLYEAIGGVYASFDPETASGAALTSLSSLTGTLREAATKSTVTLTLNLDNGTTVPAGSIVAVAGNTTIRFVTLADITNTSGITDDFEAEAEAEVTGAVSANSGTLTVIITPTSGWNSVTNALDAVPGAAEETDPALRLRRDTELRSAGRGSKEAIKAGLLLVDEVEKVFVFENTPTVLEIVGTTDIGLVECLVKGGVDQDVAEQLYVYKAAGIGTFGDTTVSVEDSEGNAHDVNFSRPTEIPIYIDITLVKTDDYAVDGDDQVKTNINDYFENNFDINDDVISNQIINTVLDVIGVYDVTSILIYSNDSLGSESLSEGNFATHADWDTTGDFTDTTGAGVYTHSAGTGTLTQTSANLAIAGVASRWYKLVYTVSSTTGACTAEITTAFAETAQALDLSAGTHTLYFHSAEIPGDFVISATSTSGGFTLDDLTLKILNTASGNFTIDDREIATIDTSQITVF